MHDIRDWIKNLRETKKLIVVEGKKDKQALARFGINNTITIANKATYKSIEEISNKNKDCILLLDLDKEGKKLFSKMRHHLQKNGVKIDNKFRNFLFKKTKLSHIEGLPRYIKNS